MSRQDELASFLAASGYGDRDVTLLAGDASNRQYFRLSGQPPLVVMDAPPEKGEDVRPFVQMTDYLRGLGYSAPAIPAQDEKRGFLVLEDLGDDLYARVVEQIGEQALYCAAVDLLVDLHQRTSAPDLAPYDWTVYARELRLLTEWYLPAAGAPVSDAAERAFLELFEDLCAPLATEVTVLRDYHAENLLWLGERPGLGAVGLLDYQDALIGHRAYDLVSLLEDARRDVSEPVQKAMLDRYIMATGVEADAFRREYAILGAQRNIKILGIFARLCRRDGKPGYVDLMPRVWAHLQRDLAHPALAPLRTWVAANVPAPTAEVRGQMVARS
ncbi:aminoglycoside phosphotransferase family protein [Pontivivens insulae]|uniref:Aminoglycoside phosphotransferase domain-containing protein n=1 Tax=Pontivivens insulae TaxID=1639689 RepID=A0A2R8AF70_9RHOB|nr:phosphotransferase [Pontivivens insulae]RED12091.1 hypothetical protein DFR53_2804 [Pontivivens insulae]SPF30847.1 hypothetical protein POI8812_03191 [Pontivivens insulae]